MRTLKLAKRFHQSGLLRCFSNHTQQRTPIQLRPDQNAVDDFDVTCLMLHPVGWPNYGPNLELYLAEEAIGLVKSMDWGVAKGPSWQTEQASSSEEEISDSLLERQ